MLAERACESEGGDAGACTEAGLEDAKMPMARSSVWGGQRTCQLESHMPRPGLHFTTT